MIASDTHWDAIVIGTGIGGGVAGRALAEAGLKVLFLERGPAGYRSEENGLSEVFVPEARLARGLWPDPLHLTLNGKSDSFYAPLGAGIGGSSVFYAATLERPERHDLDDSLQRPHPTGGWPVAFADFAPWFDKAAKAFQVYGTEDPLATDTPIPLLAPPEHTATEQALMASLNAAGLHPYHAHTAVKRIPDCRNCLGVKCPKVCKMDGRSAGVEPALKTGNAAMQVHADVVRLIEKNGSVSAVQARIDGQLHLFTADRFILSAGAFGSPRLLLRSANESNPKGIGNRSDQVGRNLMFHVNEMFALWPKRGTPDCGPTKAISFRDFYHSEGQRFGTVQAMGIRASYGEINYYLNRMLAQSRFSAFPGLSQLTRFPAAVAHHILGHAQIFVGLMEDLPYAENRIVFDPADPDRLQADYSFTPELKARHKAFRKAISNGLRGHRHLFLGRAPELNYGHPCGTLRFGEDASTSVLDRNCRVFGQRNLWVADASFMPTSMGVNPSLTIAANALRVANAVLESGP